MPVCADNRMKRSLLSHYFTLCATVTLTSIALLGVMLVALSANYFRDERLTMLEHKARQAARLVTIEGVGDNLYIDSRTVLTNFSILSVAAEADIFLVDSSGRVLVCSDLTACVHKDKALPRIIMDGALSANGYKGVSDLGTIYPTAQYAVGIPVTVQGAPVASVFAVTSADSLSEFLRSVFRMFLIGSAVAVGVAFIAIYFSTEALVRPLRAMARATDSFSKGDFSVRVPVEGDEEVEQLACAFNNMADALAGQELSGRSFVANVSHELRTPMTSIGGFIDGMIDGTIPPDKFGYYLGIVSNEVKRLSRMVMAMLNISRIEAGEMKLHPQTVDINEIVCRAVLGFERSIDEKHIDVLGLDVEKTLVDADPDLALQIVYNLIENAVKFTPEGGSIEIDYQNDGKMVRVSIRNNGEGIPKEEIPRLFDRFYKSDRSRSQDVRGVGLGLNIVKLLVNLHGGNITVSSAEGEYAEFAFTLPVSKTPVRGKGEKGK